MIYHPYVLLLEEEGLDDDEDDEFRELDEDSEDGDDELDDDDDSEDGEELDDDELDEDETPAGNSGLTESAGDSTTSSSLVPAEALAHIACFVRLPIRSLISYLVPKMSTTCTCCDKTKFYSVTIKIGTKADFCSVPSKVLNH